MCVAHDRTVKIKHKIWIHGVLHRIGMQVEGGKYLRAMTSESDPRLEQQKKAQEKENKKDRWRRG